MREERRVPSKKKREATIRARTLKRDVIFTAGREVGKGEILLFSPERKEKSEPRIGGKRENPYRRSPGTNCVL